MCFKTGFMSCEELQRLWVQIRQPKAIKEYEAAIRHLRSSHEHQKNAATITCL